MKKKVMAAAVSLCLMLGTASALTSATIGNGLTELSYGVFAQCKKS